MKVARSSTPDNMDYRVLSPIGSPTAQDAVRPASPGSSTARDAFTARDASIARDAPTSPVSAAVPARVESEFARRVRDLQAKTRYREDRGARLARAGTSATSAALAAGLIPVFGVGIVLEIAIAMSSFTSGVYMIRGFRRGPARPTHLRKYLFYDLGVVSSASQSSSMVQALKTGAIVAPKRTRAVLRTPDAAEIGRWARRAGVTASPEQCEQVAMALTVIKRMEYEEALKGSEAVEAALEAELAGAPQPLRLAPPDHPRVLACKLEHARATTALLKAELETMPFV